MNAAVMEFDNNAILFLFNVDRFLIGKYLLPV